MLNLLADLFFVFFWFVFLCFQTDMLDSFLSTKQRLNLSDPARTAYSGLRGDSKVLGARGRAPEFGI
jgi:hypothetical protein